MMSDKEPPAKPVVLSSYESSAADRCVDFFRRPDGTFGFEEYRREPEDGGLWTRTGSFGAAIYATRDEALAAAMSAIAWLGDAAAKR